MLLLNIAVYRLAVLTMSSPPTKHNLLSFMHIFVINRLKFGKTCIDTCLSTSDNLYHCIISSPLSKSKERKRNNEQSNFFIYQEIRHYAGITVFFSQYVIIRHFLIPHITKQAAAGLQLSKAI